MSSAIRYFGSPFIPPSSRPIVPLSPHPFVPSSPRPFVPSSLCPFVQPDGGEQRLLCGRGRLQPPVHGGALQVQGGDAGERGRRQEEVAEAAAGGALLLRVHCGACNPWCGESRVV